MTKVEIRPPASHDIQGAATLATSEVQTHTGLVDTIADSHFGDKHCQMDRLLADSRCSTVLAADYPVGMAGCNTNDMISVLEIWTHERFVDKSKP